MNKNIAIVGATGLVGRKTLEIIVQRNLLCNNFFLFASKKNAGKKIKLGNKKYIVEELNKSNISKQKLDYALMCVKEQVSKQFVEYLANKGTKVIDFSSYFRASFPLIVPEINFLDIGKSNIICNPNCSTAQSVVALNIISKKFGLKDIVYSTYQAVSGAGKLALNDIHSTSLSKLKKLDYPICNNFIPYIGEIDKQNYSTEENKMIFETKKILHLYDTNIIATCVRIPVENCHGVSICFTTKKDCKLKQIKNALMQSAGVNFSDSTPPMPIFANNCDDVFVGRLKAHKTQKNCFSMVVCADNLRKGASLNAVQILERLMEGKNEV